MYEKEEIIEDYIREELSDVPNILNNELSLNLIVIFLKTNRLKSILL